MRFGKNARMAGADPVSAISLAAHDCKVESQWGYALFELRGGTMARWLMRKVWKKQIFKTTMPRWVVYLGLLITGSGAFGIILWATWMIVNARLV
jgi:hypothetical protein